MTLVLWLRPSFTNDLKIFELHNPKNGTLQDDVWQVLRIASLISLSASQILAKNLLHLPCVELRVRDTALRYLYKAANPGFPFCHRGIHVDTSITICVSNRKYNHAFERPNRIEPSGFGRWGLQSLRRRLQHASFYKENTELISPSLHHIVWFVTKYNATLRTPEKFTRRIWCSGRVGNKTTTNHDE